MKNQTKLDNVYIPGGPVSPLDPETPRSPCKPRGPGTPIFPMAPFIPVTQFFKDQVQSKPSSLYKVYI